MNLCGEPKSFPESDSRASRIKAIGSINRQSLIYRLLDENEESHIRVNNGYDNLFSQYIFKFTVGNNLVEF